ncbi:MAG: RNA polymerase sigma factor [Saprospiraceae bacterium]
MNKQKNLRFLKGIAENDFVVLEAIYRECLPRVRQYVLRNSGSIADAKDAFQEGIVAIFNKVSKDELVLTTDFENFLFLVCKRIWLKKLKKKERLEVTLTPEKELGYEVDYAADLLQTRKWKLFNQKFALLTDECQRVLKMLFAGQSSRAIANEMDYTEEYAKRKKYRCKKSLIELITNDKEYTHLKG